MATYTPGSFTKNFSWDHSYERLHTAIRAGFRSGSAPVTRDKWRADSGIADKDRELIPMNFFLYSAPGTREDYLLVDQLVDAAMDPYDQEFAQLALFSFHMANSGKWRNSHWPDGKVAGWANELILTDAWSHDDWTQTAFLDSKLFAFIKRHVKAEEVTQRKVFTNYRYMLGSAGVLVADKLQPKDLRRRWLVDAVLLFWDRQIFDGFLNAGSSQRVLENTLIDNEVYKLLRCDKDQCRAFARAAFPEFSQGQAADRARQLQKLRDAGAIAA